MWNENKKKAHVKTTFLRQKRILFSPLLLLLLPDPFRPSVCLSLSESPELSLSLSISPCVCHIRAACSAPNEEGQKKTKYSTVPCTVLVHTHCDRRRAGFSGREITFISSSIKVLSFLTYTQCLAYFTITYKARHCTSNFAESIFLICQSLVLINPCICIYSYLIVQYLYVRVRPYVRPFIVAVSLSLFLGTKGGWRGRMQQRWK